MQKTKKIDGKKFAFLIELIPLFLCFELIYMILSKKTEAWNFLQFFSNETQVWYPYSSFWVLLLKGASNGLIVLCFFALIVLICRVVNIVGLFKRKKASFMLMAGFHTFDLLCVIIAFFTSTNGPGTTRFGSELLDLIGAFVVTVLVWIVVVAIFKPKKKPDKAMQNQADGFEADGL